MNSRAGRWPLALYITALTALGACSDDQRPITGPSAQPNTPNLAVGDIITVTNTKGGTDAGSLRWAVAQATGGEVIGFDPRLAGSTITLDSTLVISKSITIEGPADKGITVSGGGKGRVIDIAVTDLNQPATKLRNLSITAGKLATEGGAGIRSSSSLVLEHTTVWGNEAVAAPAILTFSYGQLTLVNSTVSGNTSTGYLYPAIIVGDKATIDNSTIAYNSMGGIWFSQFVPGILSNSIIAHNGSLLNNCGNADIVIHQGTSISNDMSCGVDSTDVVIADPKLDMLRDNGGPSMTHALTPVSPAFNGTFCALAVDQRYKPRDARCDIGACESTDLTTVTLAIDRVASLYVAGNTAIVSGTMACSRAGDQFAVQVKVRQRGTNRTEVEGTGVVNVTCTTAAQPWTASVLPSAGVFIGGSASASATTYQAPNWVAPATASRNIKLL
jgi:hypothetical protein